MQAYLTLCTFWSISDIAIGKDNSMCAVKDVDPVLTHHDELPWLFRRETFALPANSGQSRQAPERPAHVLEHTHNGGRPERTHDSIDRLESR
jgi:hypothetical protein